MYLQPSIAYTPAPRGSIDYWTGLGMGVSTMVGIGVFVSAGFMVQELGPGWVLLAWVVGALIALAGTRAYAALAALNPASGGEYRYLSDLLHPALGYIAGWASLLLGFAAPIAINAAGASAFAQTLWPGAPVRLLGVLFIAGLTTLHAMGLRSFKWTQNLLIALKVALLLGFLGVGVALGSFHWPSWAPLRQGPGLPLGSFAVSLFYIAYAFSGWNSAAYVAAEFTEPRDVPRVMIVGCVLVAVLYLLINCVFVANLPPDRASLEVAEEARHITLGHLVIADLLGPAAGRAMSVLMIITFLSAVSAMIYLGAHVLIAMARDGFLPAVLAGEPGRPPALTVVVQGGISIAILLTHQVRQVLQSVGAVLTLFAALSALALFRVWFRPGGRMPPTAGSLVGSFIYVVSAAWMLYYGFRDDRRLVGWMIAIVALGLIAYHASRRAVRERPQ